MNEDGTFLAGTQWIRPYSSFTAKKRELGVIAVFEIPSMKMLAQHKIHSKYAHGIVFSPDNVHIASSSEDKTIKIWDYHSGEVNVTIDNYRDIRDLAYIPDGRQLVGGSPWRGSNTCTFWDVNDGTEVRVVRHCSGRAKVFGFTKDGEYFTAGGSQEVVVWNFTEGFSYGPLRHLSSIRQISFTEKDRLLTVIDQEGNVYIWDFLSLSPNAI
jgi:WD40 repeat protein